MEIRMIGLGVMGRRLWLNMADPASQRRYV
jgi:6-phosphogluconate dehydrogenase